MGWTRDSASICLCTFLLGCAEEFVRIASPLCDWHWVACEETAETPAHMTDISSVGATSSG